MTCDDQCRRRIRESAHNLISESLWLVRALDRPIVEPGELRARLDFVKASSDRLLLTIEESLPVEEVNDE